LCETLAALPLLGLLCVDWTNERLLPIANIMLLVLYVALAMATEALIVSSLRPDIWRSVILNVFVGAIISISAWINNFSWRVTGSIAFATFLLRLLVAGISMQAPLVLVRRVTAGLAGSVFLLETLSALYSTGEGVYYDYYFYPKVKENYIVPTRWQDFVGLTVFFGSAVFVLYLSYRLLKYAFRSVHRASTT
jgi:hypothetical protein